MIDAVQAKAPKPIRLSAQVFLGAILFVAACAELPYRQPGERTAELPAGKGLIQFAAPATGDTPVRRVQYTDNEQRIDCALYRGGGAQAEFIYMERPYLLNVAFNFSYTIRDKVEAWNFSRGQAARWGEAVRVRTDLGLMFFRPYRLTGLNRECIGVSGEWDMAVEDTSSRYTRILFGYYCAPPGEVLADADKRSLVRRLAIRDLSLSGNDNAAPIATFYNDVEAHFGGPGAGRRALRAARGTDTPTGAGIGEFPFLYAEYYFNDNDKCTSSSPC
jgi:hypothetical protein